MFTVMNETICIKGGAWYVYFDTQKYLPKICFLRHLASFSLVLAKIPLLSKIRVFLLISSVRWTLINMHEEICHKTRWYYLLASTVL